MKRIALTLRVTNAPDYDEPRDSISHDWLKRLRDWGMTPILIPNLGQEAVPYLIELAPDVLVLTGGDDLGVTPKRDATETCLLEHALASGLPILGVCRGLQLINSHFGGSLAPLDGHVSTPHSVAIAEPWKRFYGESITVNSFHDMGVPVDGAGQGLTLTATDAKGNMEGFCHPEKPLAGVMWHPERHDSLEGDRALLAGLAEGVSPWR